MFTPVEDSQELSFQIHCLKEIVQKETEMLLVEM